jgi:hypothetical protein
MSDSIIFTDAGGVSSAFPDSALSSLYVSDSATDERRVYWNWNNSSITNIEDVVNIQLKIYGGTGGDASTLYAHRVTGSWSDSTLTWNNQPGFVTTPKFDFEYTDVAHYYTFDGNIIVGEALDGVYTNYGIVFTKMDGGSSGSASFANIIGAGQDPYIYVTYLGGDYDNYYSIYSTDLMYNTYIWYVTGNGRIEQGQTNQSTYETQLNVRPPWSSSYEDTIYLDVGESYTYSTSITGGTEYFIVENYDTGYHREIGYYPIYFIKWYRDYGKRYVKTDGDDDAGGNNWNNAWKTVNKGMEETPANYELHVGFGTYSSEPANNKLSPDNANVTVIFETATTGGGTGTASIEVN